jgi:hypothetical protein
MLLAGAAQYAGAIGQALVTAPEAALESDAGGLSLRRISAKLAEAGQLNENGQPYNAQSIRAMLRGPQKRKRPRV